MEITQVNNVQIAFEKVGKGSPLVLIHGYPLDHSIWNETAKLLQDDFQVLLPDVRGFGESTTVDSPYSMTDIADDLAGLLDALKIDKAFFAGHSMGGYVALAFAKKYTNRVSGLALVSTQLLADPEDRKQGRYKTAADVSEKGVGIVAEAMTDKLSSNQKVRDVIRPLIEKQRTSGVVGTLKAMAEREDATALFSAMNYPVILVHGDADELISVERAREAKAILSSAHLVELAGVGHMPMMEVPKKTADALKLFK